MKFNEHIAPWIVSVERSALGYTYVRLYADAPQPVRNHLVNRFGKGTVFLRPLQEKPLAS
jgi:hypothetical protein